MYKVILLPQAEKVYVRLFKTQKTVFTRIDRVLESLKADPLKGKLLKGKLKGKRSLRVGDFRTIYLVKKKIVTVYVLDIGHRREIYH